MTRQLIVMRHAKAGPYSATDHERELTPRGVNDAREAGEYLASVSMVPDYALVSSATRAVATWEAVAEASGASAEVHLRDALYDSDPMIVIEALRGLPEEVERAIFVGHNPNAQHLANLLNDGKGEPEAISRLREGYPSSALTVFDVPVPWAEVRRRSCRVVDFHVGRGRDAD